MKTTNTKCAIASVMLMTLSLLIPMESTHAQNKVVVIPLLGDDAPSLGPTAPIVKVSPSRTDYTIMDDTVIDNVTRLEWQRQDDDNTRTWQAAADYCASLMLDSKTDWRLPEVLELQSIVDYRQAGSVAIDSAVFPNTKSSNYWSVSSNARGATIGDAWFVVFDSGRVLVSFGTNLNYVRCVR